MSDSFFFNPPSLAEGCGCSRRRKRRFICGKMKEKRWDLWETIGGVCVPLSEPISLSLCELIQMFSFHFNNMYSLWKGTWPYRMSNIQTTLKSLTSGGMHWTQTSVSVLVWKGKNWLKTKKRHQIICVFFSFIQIRSSCALNTEHKRKHDPFSLFTADILTMMSSEENSS